MGDLSSRARRGTTPLAEHSEHSVEHTPGSNIKLSAQTTRENPSMLKYHYRELFFD